MKRYIDAEKISYFVGSRNQILARKEIIDEIPTADVEEVRHGVWKDMFEERVYALSRKYTHKRVCSICDKQANRYYSYCPNCGAKMDGGNE